MAQPDGEYELNYRAWTTKVNLMKTADGASFLWILSYPV